MARAEGKGSPKSRPLLSFSPPSRLSPPPPSPERSHPLSSPPHQQPDQMSASVQRTSTPSIHPRPTDRQTPPHFYIPLPSAHSVLPSLSLTHPIFSMSQSSSSSQSDPFPLWPFGSKASSSTQADSSPSADVTSSTSSQVVSQSSSSSSAAQVSSTSSQAPIESTSSISSSAAAQSSVSETVESQVSSASTALSQASASLSATPSVYTSSSIFESVLPGGSTLTSTQVVTGSATAPTSSFVCVRGPISSSHCPPLFLILFSSPHLQYRHHHRR